MKRFDTREYRASHMADPRGTGTWAFRPATRAAKAALPAGEWVVLP